MKNNWNELKDIKAPQELKERTLAAAREARKLTNEPLHAVPRHPWVLTQLARPWVAWRTTYTFMRLVPAPITPRRPAVQS